MTTPPYIRRSGAEMKLEDVTDRLRFWQTHKDSTAESVTRLRLRDLAVSYIVLEALHQHLDPDLRINIQTGEEEVPVGYSSVGGSDLIQEGARMLGPGTTLPFERTAVMCADTDPTFYIGSSAVLISLPTLAQTISVGGTLSVVVARQTTNA